MDVWSQGISRVIESCKENDYSNPEFQSVAEGLRVTLRPSARKKQIQHVFDMGMDISEKIVALMRADLKINIKDIVKLVGLSEKSVKYIINELKTQGMISREDSSRYGSWIVIDDNVDKSK
ncbi:MAG: hypothetical protein GX137_07360 [Thermoplasmatales archaeon]|nr:hypothetical protein [Thermoplasmatales archaeon]